VVYLVLLFCCSVVLLFSFPFDEDFFFCRRLFLPSHIVHSWVKLLQSMSATDEITADMSRQLELDINTSYSQYVTSLQQESK
jgi:hypothetical protein